MTELEKELTILLESLCQSFECYSAHKKPEEEWDEYDYWMFPIWIRAKKKLNGLKKEAKSVKTQED